MSDSTTTPPGAPERSGSYVLPVEDTDFLLRDEMRAIRFSLEYAKAELLLRDWGIRSTIIVFGSARVPSPESLARDTGSANARAGAAESARATRQAAWYQAARDFARIASERGGALAQHGRWRDNVIATGGGPGIMEAANRGASDAGAPTIGFNISLPEEQHPNRYITPELAFRFHYFAMRKMHFAMRARALVVFPGGFGTLDELFEMLTLRQTGKGPAIPIVLYDREYWSKIVGFDAMVAEGMIKPGDLELFGFAESPEECWNVLVSRGLQVPRVP